jgi:hypothetical protein
MNGVKYKLAHKRSDKNAWNITDKTQRNHLIKILKQYIKELEQEPVEDFILSESGISKKKEIKTTKEKEKKELELEPA